MTEKLMSYQNAAKLPLLIAVDEEGGTVNRVSSNPAFRNQKFSSSRNLYAGGGMDWVLYEEHEKCALLTSLGINVNLGPVCDIATDPSAFMYRRSLGQDPQTTADFVTTVADIMSNHKIGCVLKHFPGYGNNADTHTGIAVDTRALAELERNDLMPFAAGIQSRVGAIMMSHIIVSCLDPDHPASLSPAVHKYLREDMGFNGVIVTDDLAMDAICDQYGIGEAAVLAILAGNDLLCSTNYPVEYAAVLDAVNTGRISISLIDSAVYRILSWKSQIGILSF
jgi:beta-N-acetylhexosaminidase